MALRTIQLCFRRKTLTSFSKYLKLTTMTDNLSVKFARNNATTSVPPSIKLTSETYPHIKRLPFAKITNEDINFFENEVGLGKSRVVTDPDEVINYNSDWMKMFRGSSSLVLKPKTTEEVSKILSYCNERKLAVCPQGGNTGLVGGSTPIFDEIILNTSLMNEIIRMDEISGVLECQAGCVLENLEKYANERGFIVPIDLGAKGSCQIGGNVSTNAGGLRLLRYGSLHGNVLGLEIVLANGDVLDCMNSMKKDNTGYDLKHLFIGAEGTLGMVTKVSIQCPPQPKSVNLAFLGATSFENVLKTFKVAKSMLSEVLSSFEMMDEQSVEPVDKYYKIKPPIAANRFYMLIETSGSNEGHDEEKLSSFLEYVLNEGCITDGTLATGPAQAKSFWNLREHVPMAHFEDGYAYKYDISLPLNEYYNLVLAIRDRLKDVEADTVGYGHIGDNNLHLTVTAPRYEQKTKDLIEPFIFEYASKFRGSISGEHGIGILNRGALKYSKVKPAIDNMKKMKSLLDPNCILNPYKVLE